MTPFITRSSFLPRDRARASSLTIVAIIHVAAFYLLSLSPAREAINKASALMVTLISEQPKAASKPDELPRPLPVTPTFVRPEPVPVALISTAALADNSAPLAVAQPPAQPVRQVQAGLAPSAALAPPRFDADYLDNPAPAYPRLSKRLGEVGSVMLLVYVDADGHPGQIDIQSSSRFERLDQAGIEAVRRWRFVAAKQGEKAVAAWGLVPIHFSLRS